MRELWDDTRNGFSVEGEFGRILEVDVQCISEQGIERFPPGIDSRWFSEVESDVQGNHTIRGETINLGSEFISLGDGNRSEWGRICGDDGTSRNERTSGRHERCKTG